MKILPIKEQKSINGCHIFHDVNNDLYKIYFANEEMVSFMIKPQKPGIDLIQFCGTDLSDLKNLTEDIQKSNFFKNKDRGNKAGNKFKQVLVLWQLLYSENKKENSVLRQSK